MGVAVITQQDRCLAKRQEAVSVGWIKTLLSHGNQTQLEQQHNSVMAGETGKVCRLCIVACPVPVQMKERAIRFEQAVPVIGPCCVGCGACEEVCPEHLIHIEAGSYPAQKTNWEIQS